MAAPFHPPASRQPNLRPLAIPRAARAWLADGPSAAPCLGRGAGGVGTAMSRRGARKINGENNSERKLNTPGEESGEEVLKRSKGKNSQGNNYDTPLISLFSFIKVL